MGAPKPWPTRWPEPDYYPFDDDDYFEEPDYEIEDDPQEESYPLPEERIQSVTWGVTHPCNLRCVHCYDVVDYRRQDLNTVDALDVIQRLAWVGVGFVVFSGGEPLLRKDLFDLMLACQSAGMKFGMRSNATLVTQETAGILRQLGLAVIGVSLDGATAETHDAVRGPGSFQKTMQGIALLRAADIPMNIEVVLSRRNVHQSLACVELAEQLGVQEINFSALTPQGRGAWLREDYLDYPTWREVTTSLYQASQTSKMTVSPACALVGACVACIEPNITCDGWVTPCYLSKRRLFHLLETPVEEFIPRLRQARLGNLDVCGRPKWTAVKAAHVPANR